MSKTKTTTTEKKINVHKYLQANPQGTYIDALMIKLYPMEFHTTTEWNEIVQALLSKKTK